ncbi:hypothetical protein [Nocardia jejuensis]|uniref:hypothetical protein n=1 Tax=Nocardia jejuensis TaxID=328049 RepID=UPI00082EE56D|nr:hypothetical protein [Nocardia jejuensis]
MLEYSAPAGPGRVAEGERNSPVADSIPPAVTVADYLAHRQRSVAIRLIMHSPPETRPRSVLEFVERCDADQLRAAWHGIAGSEALIATATAGPLPVLALVAAELLDRAHRWQDLAELERAAESAGYRARWMFRNYVASGERDAENPVWISDRMARNR